MVSLYKSHLRSATASGDNAKIVDPFLCLNIACPPGSYDANVEPAKDDVIFADSELLLRIVERWFHSIYGAIQSRSPRPVTESGSALMPRGIELLLARKEAPVGSASFGVSPPFFGNRDGNSGATRQPISDPRLVDETQMKAPPDLLPSHDGSTPISAEELGAEACSAAIPAQGKSVWKDTMYAEAEAGEDSEGEGLLDNHLQEQPRLFEASDLDEEEHLRDVKISNPWAFAKLNSATRPLGQSKQLHTPRRQNGDVYHSIAPSSDDLPERVDQSSRKSCLPRVREARSSPEAAYPTPSPFPFPQRARGKRNTDEFSVNAPAPPEKESHKHGALDTWLQKSPHSFDEHDESPDIIEKNQGSSDLPYSRDFVSARSLPPGGTPLSEIPDASQRPRQKHAPRKQQQGEMKKPFMSPVNDPKCVWFQIGRDSLQKRPQKARRKTDHPNTAAPTRLILHDDEIEDDESVTSTPTERALLPIHPDLAITLDYEARKQKASEVHRKVLQEQASAAKLASKAKADAQHTTPSPHKNRQAKAIAALHTSDTPSTATRSSGMQATAAFEPSDPRAHLLRIHQQGEQGPASLSGKSKRQKTAMLPFETVKQEDYTGGLTLIVEDVNVGDVNEDMTESGAWDSYVRRGYVGAAFAKAGAEECARWEGRLRAMLRGIYAVDGEGDGRANVDLDLDLSKISQAQTAGHA